MSPEAFFHGFFQLLGPIPYPLPDAQAAEELDPREVDFTTGERPSASKLRTLRGLLDTAHLAHICLRNQKYLGPESAREIFDAMASMWGKRILELFQASFRVQGGEKMEGLGGKILLVCNHKSHTDFALSFFALSRIRLASGRCVRPRFVTAKDHFVDNVLVYELLGVGRLIETVDMVFIERKNAHKGQDSLSQAAEFLVTKPIEIAIFPQGTRALPYLNGHHKPSPAGYYSTVPPKASDDHQATSARASPTWPSTRPSKWLPTVSMSPFTWSASGSMARKR